METEFILPRGYVDERGEVHQHGRIRLALAIDEIEAINDPRVQQNASYLPILLLSRVITQLGSLPGITPQVLEQLFASDLAYLHALYVQMNSAEQLVLGATCPACQARFQLQITPLA